MITTLLTPILTLKQQVNSCSKQSLLGKTYYQGYFNNLSYLLHLSENKKDAPLIIYFRGDFGLGSSFMSLNGLGPFELDQEGEEITRTSKSYLS